jgi:hypothetical protein
MWDDLGHFQAGYEKYTAAHQKLICPQYGTEGFDLGSNDA